MRLGARPVLFGVALAACQPALPPDDPMPTTPEGLASCGADRLQHLVGQPVGALDGMAFEQPVRLLFPDTAMTEDYAPHRLNIESMDWRSITRLWCG